MVGEKVHTIIYSTINEHPLVPVIVLDASSVLGEIDIKEINNE